MKIRSWLFNFLVLILFVQFISCRTTINYVSYSFVGTNNRIDSTLLPRSDFINYDNYIFEFVLNNDIESVFNQDGKEVKSTFRVDTIGLYVHDLNTKTFMKIWPFDTSFSVLKKPAPALDKSEGFFASFNNTNNNYLKNNLSKNTVKIDGLKIRSFRNEDTAYVSEILVISKKDFRSPYEQFITRESNESMVGYKIVHKKSSDFFGESIADIKPLNKITRERCRVIIEKINAAKLF